MSSAVPPSLGASMEAWKLERKGQVTLLRFVIKMLECQRKKSSWPEKWDLKQDLLTSRVAGTTEQEKFRAPLCWEGIRFYRQRVMGWVPQTWDGGWDHDIKILTFPWGCLCLWEVSHAWAAVSRLSDLWRSDNLETAGLGPGGSLSHEDLLFFRPSF